MFRKGVVKNLPGAHKNTDRECKDIQRQKSNTESSTRQQKHCPEG